MELKVEAEDDDMAWLLLCGIFVVRRSLSSIDRKEVRHEVRAEMLKENGNSQALEIIKDIACSRQQSTRPTCKGEEELFRLPKCCKLPKFNKQKSLFESGG